MMSMCPHCFGAWPSIFFRDLPYHAHRRCHVSCALVRQRPPSGFSARSMGGRVYMLIACYGNSVRGIVQAALVEMPLPAWTSWPPILGPFNDPRFGPNENDKDCPCYSCLAGIWPQKSGPGKVLVFRGLKRDLISRSFAVGALPGLMPQMFFL